MAVSQAWPVGHLPLSQGRPVSLPWMVREHPGPKARRIPRASTELLRRRIVSPSLVVPGPAPASVARAWWPSIAWAPGSDAPRQPVYAAPMIDKRIAFIGVGSMGEAIFKGLLAAGAVGAEQVRASHPRADRRAELEGRHGVTAFADNAEAAAGAEVVILCVKPQILTRVLDELGPSLAPRA